MDFRGIDPDGLIGVANAAFRDASQIRLTVQPAVAVLHRNGIGQAMADLAGHATRAELWCAAVADELRWRANAIRDGQTENLGSQALFAVEAPLAGRDLDNEFAYWLRDRRRSQERVDAATAGIAVRLSQGLWDWDVTNNDLQEIQSIISDLAGDELDRVLAALTPRQLGRWVAEMSYSYNGFSREEKQELFSFLAVTANGASLAKLHEAMLSAGRSEELLDLGRAIAQQAAEQAIVDFVDHVTLADMSRQFSGLAPGVAIAGLESEQAAGRCLRALTEHEGALEAIALDSLVLTESPERFESLLGALKIADQGHAAAFVAVSALPNDRYRLTETLEIRTKGTGSWWADSSSNDRILDSLLNLRSELLMTDPAATIKALAQTVDPDGSALTRYWHELIDQRKTQQLATLIDSLRGGREIHPIVFAEVGTDPTYDYPQARNLGYAAATLNMGFAQVAVEAGGNIDLINRIAGVAMTIVGLLAVPAEAVAAILGTSAEITINAHGESTKKSIDDQLSEIIDLVTTQLRPTDGAIASHTTEYWIAKDRWTEMYLSTNPRG